MITVHWSRCSPWWGSTGAVCPPAGHSHWQSDRRARVCPVSCIWLVTSPCRLMEPSPRCSCIQWVWHTTTLHTLSSPAPPPPPPADLPPWRWGRCSRPTPCTGGRWVWVSPSGQPHWSSGHGEDQESEIWKYYSWCHYDTDCHENMSSPWTISSIRSFQLHASRVAKVWPSWPAQCNWITTITTGKYKKYFSTPLDRGHTFISIFPHLKLSLLTPLVVDICSL